jgi:dTDP-4-amino-4,6-dideoxygalactose transaminase
MIPLTLPDFDKNDEAALLKSFHSTFASGDGPDCREFEKLLGEYLGVKHVFFTNSCTGALDIAFMIKEFSAGSEVLVPNFTFTSTAMAPILNGLKVILVDVDPTSGNIDFDDAERKITKNTVAISPVDYAGNPVDVRKMLALAKKYNLYTVHDAAQSIGAEYGGQKIGVFADVTCFSFHGTKNLVTGEGGAIVTNNDDYAIKIRYAREKGTDKYKYLDDKEKRGYYEYVAKGNSYVQSNILAGLGISQLKKLDSMNERRSNIAKRYNDNFCDLPGVTIPKTDGMAKRNWHLYYLQVEPSLKQKIIEEMRANGVMANIHYSPLHMNSYYAEGLNYDVNTLNGSVKFFNRLLRIPMYPTMTDEQVEKVIDVVKSAIKKIT